MAGKRNMNVERTNEPSCNPPVSQHNASLIVNKQVIPLTKKVTKLGRHLENDIVIHEEYLSRYHAEIVFENGNYVLYDKNSTGGTHVNGRKVDRCLLNSGDLISLVNIQIMFVNCNSSLVSRSMGMTQGLGGFRNER
jgi:pSer/pThr/pTyr-binding forkhead associated (FHA) protein